jgi:hypothetical protein
MYLSVNVHAYMWGVKGRERNGGENENSNGMTHLTGCGNESI